MLQNAFSVSKYADKRQNPKVGNTSSSSIVKNLLRKTCCVLVVATIVLIVLQQFCDVELNQRSLNEDDSRQLTRQTQRNLTFKNRGDSGILRAIGELGKDLRGEKTFALLTINLRHLRKR